MLNPTGILCGRFFIDAHGADPVGKEGVSFIDFLGNFSAFLQECDVTVAVHFNIAVFPQLFHGHADTGLGKGKLMDDINGTDLVLAIFKISFAHALDNRIAINYNLERHSFCIRRVIIFKQRLVKTNQKEVQSRKRIVKNLKSDGRSS